MSQDINNSDAIKALTLRVDSLAAEFKTWTQAVNTAFLQDDYNNPDFTGHRAYHKKKLVSEKELEQSKIILTRNIATWAIIGLITILGNTLVQVYIAPILKAAT